MDFEKKIEKAILEEAQKLATKHHEYHNNLELSLRRKSKRIINASKKDVKTPVYWNTDKKFNPFYVIKHRSQIAHSICNKLKKGRYSPNKPHIHFIPKKDGKGNREISVFQIPDASISKLLYEQLLEKNKHRFSAFAYAYRHDKNVHFAIQDIQVDLEYYSRIFISEFDFSDFFGSISHKYLFDQFNKNGFFITEEEKKLIQEFLKFTSKSDIGIPQGTSISLFLANLVCWKLDKELERNGLKFARYADDTVIWSNDYNKICKSFEIIGDFSKSTGVDINFKKSEGISLLSHKDLPSEFPKTKEYFEFLGYKIFVQKVAIKEKTVRKIKKEISYMLYKNLLQPLKGKELKALIIPSKSNDDPALLTAMLEIRRYLYGNLTDEKIRGYLKGYYKKINFKGIMSFYPLVNDEMQLKQLDGWLVSTIYRTLQLRAKLLKKWRYDRKNQFPFNVSQKDILRTFKEKIIYNKRLIEIPSFLRIHKAIKKGLVSKGIEDVMNPNSNQYSYTE